MFRFFQRVRSDDRDQRMRRGGSLMNRIASKRLKYA